MLDEIDYMKPLENYNLKIRYINGQKLLKDILHKFNQESVMKDFLEEIEGFIKGIHEVFPRYSKEIKMQCEKIHHFLNSESV
ncbi:MAG: hypothetical protein ACFE8A_05415 [Candidatus Hodarchaeota archaeon]